MWHVHFFPIFPAIFFLFIMVMMVVRLVMWRRYGRMGYCGHGGYQDGRFEAESLLRRRLVNGEISEEEYLHLKEILSK